MRQTFKQSRSGRNPQGVGFVILTLFISVFMILPAGLLAFELMRYNLITQELRNVTDAAALAGSAAIASAPKDLSLAAIHDLAIEAAAVTFEQNSVGSTRFGPQNVDVHGYDPLSKPPTNAHTAVLNISLEDYDGNYQERGSTNAKRVRVQSQYRETPAFAAFIGLQPTFVTNAVAVGGLPKLDLFICFDLSGSMDDQTQISLVKRFWNGNKKPESQMVEYQNLASDTIKNVFKPPTMGSAVNAFWPQNLSYGAYGGLTGNGTPWIWSEGAYPIPNKMATLRAPHPAGPPVPMPPDPPLLPKEHVVTFILPEQGKPPGNLDPEHPDNRKGHGVDPDAYANGYTDLICRVQDNSGYSYPNAETCLEASRGNLENTDVFNKSKGGEKYKTNPALKGIVPKHGYYVNYWTQVQTSRQPFNEARDALFKFLETTNLSADVHFGLDCFSNTAGIAADDNWRVTFAKIDDRYITGGLDTYPLPLLDLDKKFSKMGSIFATFNGTGIGNIDKIPDSHILALGPTGTTHLAVSLQLAIDQLINPMKTRPDAKKAILLFTDGIANEPVDMISANSLAMKQAKRACSYGIPIYTVGFAQNPDILPLQREFLGDGNHGSGEGLAYVSGNHAVYIPVTEAKDLVDAFRSVARSMAVLRPAKGTY
jgi:hypothetical protein